MMFVLSTKLICMGPWTDMKATKVDPGVMALILILLTVLLTERDAT